VLNYRSYDNYNNTNHISYAQQFLSEYQDNAHIFTRRVLKDDDARKRWVDAVDHIITQVRNVKDQISDFTPQTIDKPKGVDHALVMFTDKHNDHAEFYTVSRHGAIDGKMIVVKSNLFSVYYRTIRFCTQQHVIRQPDQATHVATIVDYFYSHCSKTGEQHYQDWYLYDVLGYRYENETLNVPSTREIVIRLQKGVSVWDWERLDEPINTPTKTIYTDQKTIFENYKEKRRHYEMMLAMQFCHDDEDVEDLNFASDDFFDDDDSY
jgi:hypothetical protein